VKQQQQLYMRYVWGICLVAACGGLLFGYDWVVIGGAKPFYEAWFGITDPATSGWAMSSALVGCVAGAVVSGWSADRFGRKIPLTIAALLFVTTSIGTALTTSFELFVWCRILGGVGIGIASALSPMYIAEISPADKRGKFVAVNQLTIVISVLPESPRWLVMAGNKTRAHAMLRKIGPELYAQQTLSEISLAVEKDKSARRASIGTLFEPRIAPVMAIGIVLAVFQQWCGINVIFNYAQEIFASAGFDINGTLKSIVATGLINLLATLLALPLVDRLGRRKLMLLGAGGLTLCYGLIAAAYMLGMLGWPVLILVLAAIAIYALTLAPVTWVLLAEIFPNRVRGLAMSVGTLALWVACFILTYTFPLLNAGLDAAGSFLLYGLICAAGFLFMVKKVPETRGITLEKLEEQLTGAALPVAETARKEA